MRGRAWMPSETGSLAPRVSVGGYTTGRRIRPRSRPWRSLQFFRRLNPDLELVAELKLGFGDPFETKLEVAHDPEKSFRLDEREVSREGQKRCHGDVPIR